MRNVVSFDFHGIQSHPKWRQWHFFHQNFERRYYNIEFVLVLLYIQVLLQFLLSKWQLSEICLIASFWNFIEISSKHGLTRKIVCILHRFVFTGFIVIFLTTMFIFVNLAFDPLFSDLQGYAKKKYCVLRYEGQKITNARFLTFLKCLFLPCCPSPFYFVLS